MPHAINIDGIHESLFILQQLSFASKSFCKTYKIVNGESGHSEIDWYYYYGNLKSLMCENIIGASIKLRILEDIIKADEGNEIDFGK